MAGLAARRALSGDPADVAVTVGLAVGAVLALRIRTTAVAARSGMTETQGEVIERRGER